MAAATDSACCDSGSFLAVRFITLPGSPRCRAAFVLLRACACSSRFCPSVMVSLLRFNWFLRFLHTLCFSGLLFAPAYAVPGHHCCVTPFYAPFWFGRLVAYLWVIQRTGSRLWTQQHLVHMQTLFLCHSASYITFVSFAFVCSAVLGFGAISASAPRLLHLWCIRICLARRCNAWTCARSKLSDSQHCDLRIAVRIARRGLLLQPLFVCHTALRFILLAFSGMHVLRLAVAGRLDHAGGLAAGGGINVA